MPRGRKRQHKATKNIAEYQQKTLVPQNCGFHIACFLQIKLEPLRNHRSATNTSDPRISSCKPCCNQVGTLPEPLFQKCPGGKKDSSRQQNTMQNTSKRPWYLRPADFILRIFLKSNWNPSGTTDPCQIPQTPGFHLVSLVAIKLEPFLNHCSRKGSSRQQNTIQNTSKRPWYLRPVDCILRVFFKSSWNSSRTKDPRQIPQTPGFHLVSLVAIELEPFLNHCSRKGSSRQQNTMQNTSKRPWYLRPVDFILHIFFKSNWNPSGTTNP